MVRLYGRVSQGANAMGHFLLCSAPVTCVLVGNSMCPQLIYPNLCCILVNYKYPFADILNTPYFTCEFHANSYKA